eukprot:jgi/Psemu1/309190/fgenesh1_kg.484_\
MQMIRDSGENENAGQQADPAGGTASNSNSDDLPASPPLPGLGNSAAVEDNRSPTQNGAASSAHPEEHNGSRDMPQPLAAGQPDPTGGTASNQNCAGQPDPA